jgi:hypothetical protein
MNVTAVVAGKVLEYKLEITHLVTVGCSFTYCQGIPVDQGWPALLSKSLDCPLVNLGLPGIGNDAIHRKLYEYIYNNSLVEDSKPLVVIAWSQPWRRESWVAVHNDDANFQNYAPIAMPHDVPITHQEYVLLENWNDEDFYRKTLLNKLSVINLLDKFNIPYIMTDAMPQDDALNENVFDKFPGLTTHVGTEYYVEPIYKIEQNDYLPCGHSGPMGNLSVKEHLLKSIYQLHPNLSFVKDKKFLTLSEYIIWDKYHQKFPEWCTFQL